MESRDKQGDLVNINEENGYILSRSRSKTYKLDLKDRGTNTALSEEVVQQETKEPHFYPSCKGDHPI